MELSIEAGWNQTPEDWKALIESEACTCLALDVEGRLAATTTLFRYGTDLAWIGMVLTRECYRRSGYARMLLAAAIESADRDRVQTLKLDATSMGEPLYRALGFVAEQPIERWRRTGPETPGTAAEDGEIPPALDREAFGVDRKFLLNSLASRGRAIASQGAFAMTRPGRMGAYLGPCIARDARLAEQVISSAISTGGTWYWDLLPGNQAAAALAKSFGFERVRELTRMSRGRERRGRDELVFAIGGFEIG